MTSAPKPNNSKIFIQFITKLNFLIMKRTFTHLLSFAIVLIGLQTLNAQDQTFEINAPDGLSGSGFDFGQAGDGWGGTMTVGESVTGNLVFVESDTLAGDLAGDTPEQGCVELLNGADVAGNIAIVWRGSCFFSDKVWWAQEAGAAAVVICNNQPGAGVINLGAGGDFAGLDTIPTGMINFELCTEIQETVDGGTDVNVTIGVQEFVQLTSATTTQTPIGNVTPLDSMSVVLFNSVDEDAEAEVTWSITAPSGAVTDITTGGTIGIAGARFFPDPGTAYTPSEVGVHTVECSNNLNDITLSQTFIITEDVFGIDNGETTGDVGGSNEAFVETYGSIYDYGYQFSTGATTVDVTDFTFGLGNWAEISTDAQGSVDFTIVVYNADPDGDGVPNVFNSYDEFDAPLGFTIYSATGEEVDGETVTTPFISDLVLPAEGHYFVFLQYNGLAVANGVSPQYLIGGNQEIYPFTNTRLILDQWYTGWGGSARPIMRLTAPEFESNTVEVLADNAVTISPNPTSAELNVNLDLENVSSEVNIQIIDVAARAILTDKASNIQEGTLSFDVSNFAAGTYFIQVITDEGSAIERFVKN